ncbi:hypothetical protein N9050_08730 [Akkermansiaceae bacterium]|nr:hypothetical protein [Akkermansiaceae bacterium]
MLGRKLITELKKNKRLPTFPPVLEKTPESSNDWCQEALATNNKETLAGILTSQEIQKAFGSEKLVSSVNNYRKSDWWKTALAGGPPRISRNTKSYLEAFGLTLSRASHVMFMDPHLDPGKPNYKEFGQLIEKCGPGTHIEIHRVSYDDMNRKNFPANTIWEDRFNQELAPLAKRYNQTIEVVIWPHEHDRHLVTNLMSYHLGNGLTTTRNQSDKMTCSKLTRAQSEQIQRECDANSPNHRFVIG